MPDTKPGLILDEAGICQACRHAERKKGIDWDLRLKELEDLCERYRGRNGDYYDCAIAVSGGKDSHFQTYVMKEKMKMNSLLLSVDNFSWTEVGRHNIQNLSEAFGCDILMLSLNRRVAKKMLRKGFEKGGIPTWYWDRTVNSWPVSMCIKLGIPLLVYGENVSIEYGGPLKEETYSARDQINNDVAKKLDWSYWVDEEIKMKDLNPCLYPTEEEIDRADMEMIFLSYFFNWNGADNLEIAKKYGFKTLEDEWKREGFIEDYDQIDAIGYLVHPWLRYYKFGFARATDVCGYWLRTGRIGKQEAIQLIKEH